jgi:hypothetical protein
MSGQPHNNLSAERLATLARAACEERRFEAPARPAESLLAPTLKKLEKSERAAALREAAPLLRQAAERVKTSAGNGESPAAAQALAQRASLELKLKTEEERARDAAKSLDKEKSEHQEAKQTLQLQRKRIGEFEQERRRLMDEIGVLESKLRNELNEKEGVENQLEKLKNQRQSITQQAMDHHEEINKLEADNERLRIQLEVALKERDARVSAARAETQEAESQTGDAAFERLWDFLRERQPDCFPATHKPTEETFKRLCEVFVDVLEAFVVLEFNTEYNLRNLRNVASDADPLSRFVKIISKQPGLVDLMKNYLTTGGGRNNFSQFVRFHQAWSRAFTSGMYKTLVRTPTVLADELNVRKWPVKSGWGGEDAAIGKHFKENIQRQLPDKIFAVLRRLAADLSYDDYNEVIKGSPQSKSEKK